MLWLTAAAALLIALGFLLWPHRRDLLALWREPVLRVPVLIVESDDWGPGPDSDAAALDALRELLVRLRDARGRHPVLTLGVILGIPDGGKTRSADGSYVRLPLADARFDGLRAAMEQGVAARVFALQLHGGEHFWPNTVRAAARRDPALAAWLQADGLPNAYELPSPLQSRWTDAATLPSRPHPREAIQQAAHDEVVEFQRTFGRSVTVVVPPTFVWTEEVERAWASAGVRWVVTPGRRNLARDAQGGLVPDGPVLRTGERSASGVRYLVRRCYFEPALGHRAERVLDYLTRDRRQGRPTLLETHRANFVGDPVRVEAARMELARALNRALEAHPDLRFSSTEELAERLESGDPGLLDRRPSRRVKVWLARAAEIAKAPGLAAHRGLAPLGAAFQSLTRRVRRHGQRRR